MRFLRSLRPLAVIAAIAVALGVAGGALTAMAADTPVPAAAGAGSAADPLSGFLDNLLGPKGILTTLVGGLLGGAKPATSLPPVEDPTVSAPPPAVAPVVPPLQPPPPALQPPPPPVLGPTPPPVVAPPPPGVVPPPPVLPPPVTPPPPAATPPPPATTPPPPATSGDPVIAAAGDIACDPGQPNFLGGAGASDACRQMATSNLVLAGKYDLVLTLGDTSYYCSSIQSFRGSFDPSWGRFKPLIRPVTGNHDYLTHAGTLPGGAGCDASNAGAAGYFQYFGASAGAPGSGYYSYDLGAWHLIALNSQCGQAGGCGPSSAQGKWLQSDLAAHPNKCTLAYWHIPLFSSGGRASPSTQTLWKMLYDAGVDVALTAHDHVYERFAPQTETGAPDPARGIREFVIGTGGANHTSFVSVAANSEVRNEATFGVLRMTLHATGYTWQFVPEGGATFTDAGSDVCH